MKDLKIKFVDTFVQPVFTQILSRRFNVITEGEPEFILFGDENFGIENRNYSKTKYTKIFFTGENRRAVNYDCNYAITFDHIDSKWHYRLPSWALTPAFYDKYIHRLEFVHNLSIPKTKFCAFIHRNGGNQLRNTVFESLMAYKHIDSPGPLFNNTKFILGPDYRDKLSFIKDYKFVFAFENSSYPGYATEKIVDAFYVNSVPIYWGSSTITEDFNEKSFINANDFTTIEDLVHYIKKVDSDDSIYYSMLKEPKINNFYVLNYENFLNWFEDTVYAKVGKRE